MMLNEITQEAGAHKRRMRIGRGESSGKGKTSGRGNKGCQSRSGGGTRPLHEGGQMPIFRRLPKRGFSNFHFRTEFAVVNLLRLERSFEDGATVDPATLFDRRLIDRNKGYVKVLGHGELTKKLVVHAHAVSQAAREAIEKAGGTITLIERLDRAAAAKAKRNSKKKGKVKAGKGAAKAKAEAAPAEPPPPTPGDEQAG